MEAAPVSGMRMWSRLTLASAIQALVLVARTTRESLLLHARY